MVSAKYTANFPPIKSARKPRVARITLKSECNYHGDYKLPEISAKIIKKFEKNAIPVNLKSLHSDFPVKTL